MQFAGSRRQTFDRRDLASVGLRRQRQAGCNAAAIDVDGAGPALPVVAAFLGACESEPFAQYVEERGARIQRQLVARPVHGEVHRNLKSGGTAAASL
jgi:hypothetical protein